MASNIPDPGRFIDTLGGVVSGDRLVLRDLAATLGAFSVRLLAAAVILFVTLWLSKRLADATRRGVGRLHRKHGPDTTLQDFASSVVRYVVVIVGLIAVLQQLGVQATSVIAVLGAASLAIGLALQGTLSNVAAGVMILLLRPLRVGDKVEVNGKAGVVHGLDLFNTKIVDYDGLTVYVPNGKVFGEMIVNVSESGRRRIELTFGVDYEDDLDKALEILTRLAGQDARILKDPKPWARVTTLADSSVNVTLRCWSSSDDWNNAKFDMVKKVKETFEAEGLSFPYPHQVSVTRDGSLPAVVALATEDDGQGRPN
jgi:small conductance mechanosensitive channel